MRETLGSMIRISRVNPLDYKEELERLQKTCLPQDIPYPIKRGEWWLAFNENGKAVAFACLSPSYRFSNGGYLSRAGVCPSARGQGLQRRLIKVRIARAKKLKYAWLFSDTRGNPYSGNNLFACGFKMFEPKAPWGYTNQVYWRMKL